MIDTPLKSGIVPVLRKMLISRNSTGKDLVSQAISLFSDNDVGALILPDPTVTTLWQDELRIIPAIADGDPVWWVDDISGRGNNFPAPISAQRPTLRTDGITWWLEHSGLQRLTIPQTGVATVSSTMGWSTFKIPPDDLAQNRGMLRGLEPNGGHWFGVFADGSTATHYDTVFAPGTIYVDNIENSLPNRDGMYDIIQTNNPIIASGVILGSDRWPTDVNYLLSYTPVGSGAADYDRFEGDLFAYIEIGRVLTSSERKTLNDFLKSRRRR